MLNFHCVPFSPSLSSPLTTISIRSKKMRRPYEDLIANSRGRRARPVPKHSAGPFLSRWPAYHWHETVQRPGSRILTPDPSIQWRNEWWEYWVSKDPANNHKLARSLKICYKLALLGSITEKVLWIWYPFQLTNFSWLTKFPKGEDYGILILKD